MGLYDRTLPLARGQLGIWLARKTGPFAAQPHWGFLFRIERTLDRGLFDSTIRHVVGGRRKRA